MKAHVSEAKKKEVSNLEEAMKKYNVIALVDLTNLPSAQLQQIRAKLRDKLLIKVSKKRLIKIAIKNLKEKDLTRLLPYLEDSMPALIFTEEDSFKLYKEIKKSRGYTFAKAGQIAPNDLVVKAGPTNFPPGPIIGELGQAGIIASVEEGKVVVKKDSVLAKEGEVINQKSADVLSKLGIKPILIGLNIKVVLDKGILYEKKVLDIDEQIYINNLRLANLEAINLSISIGYITKENIGILIRKAAGEASLISKKFGIEEKEDKIKVEIKKAAKEAGEVREKLEEKKEEPKKKEEKEEEKTKVKEEMKEEPVKEEKPLEKEAKESIYSEEDAKKAQEIIDAMKEKDIKEKEKEKKKPKVEKAPDIHKLAEEAEKRKKKEEEGGK